jgi:hypothetical protein
MGCAAGIRQPSEKLDVSKNSIVGFSGIYKRINENGADLWSDLTYNYLKTSRSVGFVEITVSENSLKAILVDGINENELIIPGRYLEKEGCFRFDGKWFNKTYVVISMFQNERPCVWISKDGDLVFGRNAFALFLLILFPIPDACNYFNVYQKEK